MNLYIFNFKCHLDITNKKKGVYFVDTLGKRIAYLRNSKKTYSAQTYGYFKI